jgi:hypothetical protein
MRQVRSDRRGAAWLALAALALQTAVSFGHVHLDGIHGGNRAATLADARAHAEQAPPQQPGEDDHDYCAICATIYLTANSFVPQPPQLPRLFACRAVEHVDRAAVVFVVAQRAPFQSRAPPLV